MKHNLYYALLLIPVNLVIAQTDLACPTDKLLQENGPATFCDSLRQRNGSDLIYADVKINNSIDPSSGDTSVPAALKKRCLYILSKYDIFQLYPRIKILPTDSTYLNVNGGVVMTKETALHLV